MTKKEDCPPNPPKKTKFNWRKFADELNLDYLKYDFRFAKKSPNDLYQLNRLLNIKSTPKKKLIPKSNVSFLTTKNQYCNCKINYSNKIQTHKKFLNVYMPQKNKDEILIKPTLFGNVSEEEYKSKMTSLHFKYILSPESNIDNPKVMQEFTKCFMERLEQDLNKKLLWQAVIHNNTAHPHVHIVINGKDKKGENVRIRKVFIKKYASEYSSEILTHMLGHRSKEQMSMARENRIRAERWTELDESLNFISHSIDDDLFESFITKPNDEKVKKRLDHLCEMKLAKYQDGKYFLEKNWKESLKTVGKYNSFLNVRSKLKGTLPHNLFLYKKEMGKVSGIVKMIQTMDDEGIWNNALVIENEKLHRAWYIPVRTPLSKKHVGEEASFEITTNLKGGSKPVFKVLNTEKYDTIDKSKYQKH